MIHFLCAYWILSKIFLRPAYALVIKTDAERTALKKAAMQKQHELIFEKQQKVMELTQFQQKIKKQSFVSECKDSETIFTQIHTAAFTQSSQEKKALVQQVTTELKKRIIHE
ncbi:MAG: hypothetical protein K2X90_04265 [Candidatus Babeliaceae bacterium]|nr:hypothetical protein [Candidatus Babeliaceae bacterium]